MTSALARVHAPLTPAVRSPTRDVQGIPLAWAADRAARILQEEYVKHPSSTWTDLDNAILSLGELHDAWLEWMGGREKPATRESIRKAANVMASFRKSLAAAGAPDVLASVTPETVQRWVAQQRALHKSEDGIASRLSTLKVFTNLYVRAELGLTTDDLLRRVKRINPPPKPRPRLTDRQIKEICDFPDDATFEGLRNRALLFVFASTGRRLREVVEKMTVAGLNPITGEFAVAAKGGAVYPTRMSPAALKAVKAYLRERPPTEDHDALWVTRDGRPLTGWAALLAIRRLREKMGVERLNSHLFRHSLAQRALDHGAERAMVMDMLGHATDKAARIYAASVRQSTAARAMPRYSPV